jgi:hypothetical protein
MFNGKYSNFTYNSTGDIKLNNEQFWGSSVLNNDREHNEHFNTIKALGEGTNTAINLSRQLNTQATEMHSQGEFLNNKLKKYEDFIDNQSAAYSSHLQNAEMFSKNAINTHQQNLNTLKEGFQCPCGLNRNRSPLDEIP